MQGVATCLFLCMDACGLLYGSRELTDDCIFNEMLEQHFYNTYSSAKYSNRGRSLYLALDRRGAPRRVQLRPGAPHGRLDAYTRVLTKPVPGDRVAGLLSRLHGVRHRGHHSACPPHGHPEPTPPRPKRCPKRRRPSGAGAGQSRRRHSGAGRQPPLQGSQEGPKQSPRPARRKCEASEDEDTCHKRLQMIAAKKRKSRNDQDLTRRRNRKAWKQQQLRTTSTATAAPAAPPHSAVVSSQRVQQQLLQKLTSQQQSSASEDEAEVEHDDDEEDSDESVTMTTEASTETVEETLLDP